MTGGPGVRIAYLTTAALAPVTLVLSWLAPTGALLPALLFWTAALQGLIALVAAADLTRARWIRPIRDVLLDLHPLLFAPAIGFLIFTREIRLYPWTQHPTGWLEPHFFILRNLVLLLLTGVLAAFYARSAHATRVAGRKTLAVVYLFAFVANQSLIAFDWVMSFEYPWTSTLFGGYFFVEALYAGIALTVLTAAWLVRRQRDTGGPSPVAAGALLDSTTLLFGFSLLWAGQFFAQFLVIWYGNLPAEVAFIARRWTAGPLGLLSRLVLWLLFLIPFIILLSRRAKTTPLFSSSMALIVLSGVLVERIVFLIPVTHLDPWVAGAAFLAYAVAFAIPYRVACGRLVSPPELPPAARPRVEPAVLLALALLTPAAIAARAQTGAEASAMVIPFDEVHWDLRSAWVGEHLGRESLAGTALLRDLEFGDGVIEVDVAVDGRRSYPGIFFRAASDSLPAVPGGSPGVPVNCERLYLRPHRAGLYPDAIQYAPAVNGVTGWQLYSGEGCTAGIELPADQWIHLRLEVQDSQARLFVGAAATPALEIPVLGRGNRRGRVGLSGPRDETAFFSNFSCTSGAPPAFASAPERIPPSGTLTGWEISRSVKTTRLNRERYPRFYTIFLAGWEPASVETDGLVNVSRLRPRVDGDEPDCVLARTIVQSDSAQEIELSFGYSDDIHLFHNGRLLYAGRNGYQSRDPSHVGVVGLFDAVALTLEPGLNEIFCYLSERFGGWGFRFQADRQLEPPLREHGRLSPAWQTPDSFLTPESVLYDSTRQVLYVSSFDNQYEQREAPSGFISRLNLAGEILDLHWATGLAAPCGMALFEDRLFTVERAHLTEIDTGSGRIVARHPIPGAAFPNDLAIDADGTAYITDTGPTGQNKGCIYRCRDGVCERWIESREIVRPNGLCIDGRDLLVGCTGDGWLKAVDLETGRIRGITCLGAGVVDGIRRADAEHYLVSHWEGQAYRVSRDGRLAEILDTLPRGQNCADFEFVAEHRLLVVPTFMDNRVIAYRLEEL